MLVLHFVLPRELRLVAVIRDSEGKLVSRKALKVPCSSSKLAKALALKEGISFAHNYLCQSILMESDYLEVIECCRDSSLCSDINVVMEDIRKMRTWFFECGLLWTPHKSNELAHHVAKLLLDGNLNLDWVVRKNPLIGRLLLRNA